MKSIVDLSTWLLDKDIRAKNASSFLTGLLAVVLFYFASRHSQWFLDLDRRGTTAIAVALLIVFLITFLAVWLVWSAVAARLQEFEAIQKVNRVAEQRIRISDTLESLSDWQWRFLFRFINEDRRQIQDYEIGEYKIVWEPEVSVLVTKGIIRKHRRGVYEIEPVYFRYIQESAEMNR